VAAVTIDQPADPAPTSYKAPAERATPPPRDQLPNMNPVAESELVGEIRHLFMRARDRKRPLVKQWQKNYKILRTRQWAEGRVQWMPAPEVPEIWPIVDAMVAWVTDQEPGFDAVPAVSPLHPEFSRMSQMAEDLRTVVRSSWHVDRTDAEVEKVVWDGFTYGIGWFKTTWDDSAYRGLGNAVQKRCDPFTVYPDPDATDPQSMNHLFEARTVSWQELERRFPGAIKRLKGDAWVDDADKQPTVLDPSTRGDMPKANPGAISPAVAPRYGLPGQDGRVQVTDDPGVTVIEAWLRTPKTDDEGNEYDCWRCVVVAGNRVLLDEVGEDLWSHGELPFDRYVPIETGEFYGTALVEMLAPQQRSINKLLAALEHNIWLMGNPVLIESNRAGLSRTVMTNKPGSRLNVNGGTDGVRWLDPPKMSPNEATELVRFYIQEMERISGLSAVVRGATPSGRNAQGVIDSVQEAAFVRIRKMKRNLAMTIGAAGEKLASLICEFYDTPRTVSLIGPGGEKLVAELGAEPFYVHGPDGAQPLRFQLLVEAGQSQSQSRQQRIGEADALYAMGAIDEEAVLEQHDFPNWQRTVQRVRELKAQEGTLGQPPTQRAAARR
jgi:hypothetical protein